MIPLPECKFIVWGDWILMCTVRPIHEVKGPFNTYHLQVIFSLTIFRCHTVVDFGIYFTCSVPGCHWFPFISVWHKSHLALLLKLAWFVLYITMNIKSPVIFFNIWHTTMNGNQWKPFSRILLKQLCYGIKRSFRPTKLQKKTFPLSSSDM